MSLPRNKNLTKTSQNLRRNMTKEERYLLTRLDLIASTICCVKMPSPGGRWHAEGVTDEGEGT
jgi:hypothetical protein